MRRALAVFAVVPLAMLCLAADAPGTRLTPTEIAARASVDAGAGSSGVHGIRNTVLSGDPARAGLYTIRLDVPPHLTIQAHRHRDARSAVVVSGTWAIGYGATFDAAALKTLPPGSFYTEPAEAPHFARTGDDAVVVYITGEGPTDTRYSP
jgi:quercetin dioxygenase-like cupin family protein